MMSAVDMANTIAISMQIKIKNVKLVEEQDLFLRKESQMAISNRSENAQGVIGTRPCSKKESDGCQGTMNIKFAWSRNGKELLLPCVAQCDTCKTWFDCQYPKVQ